MIPGITRVEGRDPRVDPQPGDILRGVGSDGRRRFVLVDWVTDKAVGVLSMDFLSSSEKRSVDLTLEDFREQTKGSDVVHISGGG